VGDQRPGLLRGECAASLGDLFVMPSAQLRGHTALGARSRLVTPGGRAGSRSTRWKGDDVGEG